MNPTEITATFSNAGLSFGRCFGSKSGYSKQVQPNRFVPNAVIFVAPATVGGGGGKVWHGDLDILHDERALVAVSRRLNRKLYILREFDGYVGYEVAPHRVVTRRAIATVWRGRVDYPPARLVSQ